MEYIEIRSKLHNYKVFFIQDFSARLQSFGTSVAYVIDKNVFGLYSRQFENLDMSRVYLLDAVEDRKNMDTVIDVISFWKEIGVRKDWKIVCIGGGITQDISTIASDFFLRNLDWYFFPTTLLSMCDSCIGGKCGINLGEYKNQIGVFYPPKEIYIDTTFLDTLSRQDYLNGWGELLKFSLTLDMDFYRKLKQEKSYIPCGQIREYIRRGLLVKKAVIEQDEFESNLRRILNYGHTFGHALEAYTNHKIPHGMAVIWGMDVVNYIAVQKGILDEETYLDIKGVIKKSFLDKRIEIEDPPCLFSIIRTDKKVRGNTLAFALLNKSGRLGVYPMDINEDLEKLFEKYLEETYDYYSN